jgi:hypothetical protein
MDLSINFKPIFHKKINAVNFNNVKFIPIQKDVFIKSVVPKYNQEQCKNAINNYISTNSINEALRRGVELSDVKILDNIIETAKPSSKKMTVYRGLQAPKGGFNEEKINEFLTNNQGFTSTTSKKDVAKLFKDNMYGKGILLEIELPEASKFIDTERAGEIILPRNSKFEIVEKINDEYYKVSYKKPKIS